MSYQSGKVGQSAGIGIVFILIIARLVIASSPAIISATKQAAWQTSLLSGLMAFVMLWLVLYIMGKVSGDIVVISQKLMGHMGAWFVGLTYFIVFWLNAITLLRQYSENTLSVALPQADFEVVLLWFIISAGIMCYYGFEVIDRTAYAILPYAFLLIMMVFLLLAPFYRGYNLFPLGGMGWQATLLFGLQGAGYNIGAFARIIMAASFQNIKTVKIAATYGIGLSIFLKIVYLVGVLMVFGATITEEKNVIFYELTRMVYINRYFQRIESLLIVLWVVMGILVIAIYLYIAIYLFTRLFKMPAIRPIVVPFALITMYLAGLPQSFSEAVHIDNLIVTFNDIGIYFVPIMLYTAFKYKQWTGSIEKVITPTK